MVQSERAAPAGNVMLERSPRLDFLGIGCQRSGTSWMFNCLTAHPALRGPLPGVDREVNFFNHHYTRGYDWYHSLFDFGAWKVGEFSVLYAPELSVPERIHLYNPSIRLIACLRNPIDRAYSHHLHEARRGRLPRRLYAFEDALEFNPAYLDQGRYFTHLSRFLEVFPRDQLHLVIFDDISTDPATVVAESYRFLGESTLFTPKLATEVVNAALPVRNPFLGRVIQVAATTVKRVAGHGAYTSLRRSRPARQLVRAAHRDFRDDEIPPMSMETRADLGHFFASEVAHLGALLRRDLSHWIR